MPQTAPRMQHNPEFQKVAYEAIACAKGVVENKYGVLVLVFTPPNDEGMMESAGITNDPIGSLEAFMAYMQKISGQVGVALHNPLGAKPQIGFHH